LLDDIAEMIGIGLVCFVAGTVILWVLDALMRPRR